MGPAGLGLEVDEFHSVEASAAAGTRAVARAAADDADRCREVVPPNLTGQLYRGAEVDRSRSQSVSALRRACDGLDEMEERLRRPVSLETPRSGKAASAPRAVLGEALCKEGVRRLKRHIAAGDIFQGVIYERFELELASAPFSVYRYLRPLNP